MKFSLFIRALVFLFCIFLFSSCQKNQIKHSNDFYFSYNVPVSPQTFDPLLQRGANARYLLNHLYTTLYKWDQNGKLKAVAAEQCEQQKLSLICSLKKNLKFEDGSPILAKHFMNTVRLIQKNPNEAIDISDIKVSEIDAYTLKFISVKPKYSLLHKLTQIELSPRKEEKLYKSYADVISSTEYKIKNYVKNQFLVLNKINPLKEKKILGVKIHFIDDQATALRLFQSGILDLLTMLPVREIQNFKTTNQLFHINMVRMDGIFFNKEIQNNLNLKKALFHALNYEELKNLYESIGLPGCPALPQSYYSNSYCYKFDLKAAKKFLSLAKLKNKDLKLMFSSSGGDDIQRGMEWMANQWNKNLNLNISIHPEEAGVFLQKIKTKTFEIARKGLPLDAPSCLEALLPFTSNHPQNLIDYKNPKLDQITSDWENLKISEDMDKDLEVKKDLCDQGLRILHNDYTFIPLGPMYFSYLTNNHFKGWSINSLNILDLKELTPKDL